MIEEPQCFKRDCKHYFGIIQSDGTELTEKPGCLAFPEGIPNDIAYGKELHKSVRNDQNNNIIFERE